VIVAGSRRPTAAKKPAKDKCHLGLYVSLSSFSSHSFTTMRTDLFARARLNRVNGKLAEMQFAYVLILMRQGLSPASIARCVDL